MYKVLMMKGNEKRYSCTYSRKLEQFIHTDFFSWRAGEGTLQFSSIYYSKCTKSHLVVITDMTITTTVIMSMTTMKIVMTSMVIKVIVAARVRTINMFIINCIIDIYD